MDYRRRHRPTGLRLPAVEQHDPLFFSELKQIIETEILSSDVKAVVMHGSGRHFSSGADIGELTSMIGRQCALDSSGAIASYPPFIEENNRSFRFFDSLGVPVIAAIRGVCLGSALELAMFCHIRICGEGSVFALPETTFNLIPGCGGMQKIIGLAGMARGLEIILRGMNFSAEEALSWNVVDRMVPKKEVVDTAVSLAQKIASGYERNKIPLYLNEFLPVKDERR